jgi:hypothetical protein
MTVTIKNCKWIRNSYRSIVKWIDGEQVSVPKAQQFTINGKNVWIPRSCTDVIDHGEYTATIIMPDWLYNKINNGE